MANALFAICSISDLLNIAVKVSEIYQGHEKWRHIHRELRVSLHKLQVWQQNWSGQAQLPDISGKAFWGAEGTANIGRMMDAIVNRTKVMQKSLNEFRDSLSSGPRSRWKNAVQVIRTQKRLSYRFQELQSNGLQELQKLAVNLGRSVDELWIYSETVFDSLHGILARETKLPERERLLKSALQSRSGSLELYTLCSKSAMDCSLEMDLLDAQPNVVGDKDNSSLRLFYHLFTQPHIQSLELQRLIVENLPELDVPEAEFIDSNTSDLQFFKPRSGIIKATQHGSNHPSCLRIPNDPVGTIALESKPISLAEVLKVQFDRKILSAKDHFSTGAKVELAYKVVECGFFLLGTPWFSSLSSKNILRLKSTGSERNDFVLEIQTLDIKDLVFDDPEALTETSQIFRIGVLLMEIALDKHESCSRGDEYANDAERISKLPLVEQYMGTQYCKATAFCLQNKSLRIRFQGPQKYDSKNYDEWELYLLELLQEYYSQVFLRSVSWDTFGFFMLLVATYCSQTAGIKRS